MLGGRNRFRRKGPLLKTPSSVRLRAASRAALWHLSGSVLVAACSAVLVFALWYRFPYRDLAGGRELFLLVVSVDVVCGPLLTLVLFSPSKPRGELWRDLGMVVVIQLAALAYGMHTVWEARPLFLVHEVDRFKVVSRADVDPAQLDALAPGLRPTWWQGPVTVGLRPYGSPEEKNKILFEAAQGGRDYGDRPMYYIPFDDTAAARTLERARPVPDFLTRHPDQQTNAAELLQAAHIAPAQARYLPVRGREDWVALLDAGGHIVGFLPGDGF